MKRMCKQASSKARKAARKELAFERFASMYTGIVRSYKAKINEQKLETNLVKAWNNQFYFYKTLKHIEDKVNYLVK